MSRPPFNDSTIACGDLVPTPDAAEGAGGPYHFHQNDPNEIIYIWSSDNAAIAFTGVIERPVQTGRTNEENLANAALIVSALNAYRAIPSKPAPDAVRSIDAETIQTLLDLLNPLHGELDRQTYDAKVAMDFDMPADYGHDDISITAQMERDLTQAVLILEDRKRSAPVPPADGTPDYDAAARALGYQRIPNGTWFHPNQHHNFTERFKTADEIFERYFGVHWPSATGAAEPVAWRWKYRTGNDVWQYCSPNMTPPKEAIAERLYATPPVRGDREAIARTNLIRDSIQRVYDEMCVQFSGVHSDDRTDSWLLNLHASLQLLSLPVQSTARPDKEAAAQVIAKRHYGDKLENLEGVTRDSCRDTVTEIFELAMAEDRETFKHDDVVRLVIAARSVAFGDDHGGENGMRELDAASEQFAASIPWDNQPEEQQ